MDVKPLPTRAGRRQKAAQTRGRILEAAYRLFSAAGYEATTMLVVAEAAGVAVQTVYFVFGTKARLLAEVESRMIRGDASLEQSGQQTWAAQMQHETDPQKLVALFVEATADVLSRISPFVIAVGPALPSDPQSVAARDRGRDEFFRVVIDRLAALRSLRDGLTPSRGVDIIRVVNTVEAYADLTTHRGWTVVEWKQWLTNLLCEQLLADSYPGVREDELDV
ncbi:MAG TPA: helix-turn-helix domain-containing protein [Candidatus Dormibacteraeota bacterium]|nr:helix-turn-helix domain-containing protein [Candidatus Dormibacteraeota bacterium]